MSLSVWPPEGNSQLPSGPDFVSADHGQPAWPGAPTFGTRRDDIFECR
jgi:hypothetical protein